MSIKVGINGFGRIGRMVFRAATQNFPDIEIVGINDLLEPDYLAYMLKHDSVHGQFKGTVSVDGNTLVVNGRKIRLTAVKDPAELKWGDVGADIVVESTGLFLTKETAQKHIAAGAKKVIMSAPSKELERLVLANGFHHGGHPVLHRHAQVVAIEGPDAADNIKPAKNKSTERIDGIVGLVMAIGLAMQNPGDEKSVYEGRGLLLV